jgi:SulP family sulfate permease
MIKYIPFPVVTGFTSGIAVIIMSTQIHDFFGLQNKLPSDFLGKIHDLAGSFQPNWPTVLMATLSTLAIWFWPKKIGQRVPGSIVVILLASVAAVCFHFQEKFGIQTLGSAFGALALADVSRMARAAAGGDDGGGAGSHRVAAVGGGGGRHD